MNKFLRQLKTALLPIRIASKLGGQGMGLFSRIILLLKTYYFLARVGLGRRIPVEIIIYFNGKRIRVLLESSVDLALIREVFLDEEYAHGSLRDNAVIFDIGANIGMASAYFAVLYPHATIYAFEPVPSLYRKLQKRAEEFKNIIPLPIALTDTNGQIPFYASDVLPLSGSIQARKSMGRAELVESRTLESIAKELTVTCIDLLKFDIEGSERALFTTSRGNLKIEQLVGEVHLDLLGMTKSEFELFLPEFNADYTKETAPNRYLFRATLKPP